MHRERPSTPYLALHTSVELSKEVLVAHRESLTEYPSYSFRRGFANYPSEVVSLLGSDLQASQSSKEAHVGQGSYRGVARSGPRLHIPIWSTDALRLIDVVGLGW